MTFGHFHLRYQMATKKQLGLIIFSLRLEVEVP